MAEDPLCTHTPGKFAGSPLLTIRGRDGFGPPSPLRGFGETPPLIEYGGEVAGDNRVGR